MGGSETELTNSLTRRDSIFAFDITHVTRATSQHFHPASAVTRAMRPKHDTPDLHSQVETLTSELELSTFLNKGILQSNSEYKLRITELERENAVLRAAERRLTATEDALESADKRCRDLTKEVARLEREVEGERTGKDRCLRETASFGRRWDELRVVWQGFREGMDECLQEETKETRAERSSRGRKAPVGFPTGQDEPSYVELD